MKKTCGLYMFFGILFFSCREQNIHLPVKYTIDNAIDSFTVKEIKSTKELSKSVLTDKDSLFVAYNYYDGEINTYRLQDKKRYVRQQSTYMPNSFYIDAFYTGASATNLYLIGKENDSSVHYWYSVDPNAGRRIQDTLRLDLPYLKEGHYRFSSLNNQAIWTDDTSFCLVIGYHTPGDLANWFKEKVMAQVIFEDRHIKDVRYFFDKPRGLYKQVRTSPVFCRQGSTMLLLYPCIDSLYLYDLHAQTYRTVAINNPMYTAPLTYDVSRWQDADYFTITNLHSFYYEGIFYNRATAHYILYFTTPADPDIKTPVYADKAHYALVLDRNFRQLKIVRFGQRFKSPATFLAGTKGIYMPLYNKDKHEKDIRYYLFDL